MIEYEETGNMSTTENAKARDDASLDKNNTTLTVFEAVGASTDSSS
jgi:hypothetical protein